MRHTLSQSLNYAGDSYDSCSLRPTFSPFSSLALNYSRLLDIIHSRFYNFLIVHHPITHSSDFVLWTRACIKAL